MMADSYWQCISQQLESMFLRSVADFQCAYMSSISVPPFTGCSRTTSSQRAPGIFHVYWIAQCNRKSPSESTPHPTRGRHFYSTIPSRTNQPTPCNCIDGYRHSPQSWPYIAFPVPARLAPTPFIALIVLPQLCPSEERHVQPRAVSGKKSQSSWRRPSS
ncbi:hypothetical protein EI94DRAFT_847952 [Lactarius quietus]|nr:hypothetical protein EI94DRAFT_847952 [Lactarius quietus]